MLPADASRKAAKISHKWLPRISRHMRMHTDSEVTEANMPERAVASPEEGIKAVSHVIMKMPNPNPVTRCTKLAPMQSTIK